jgi:hypothetical protein
VGFVVVKVALGQVSPTNSHSDSSVVIITIIIIIWGWYNRKNNGHRNK